MASSGSISSLHPVYNTCLKMLKNRGYMIDPSMLRLSRSEFAEMFTSREALKIVTFKVHDPTLKMVVFFHTGTKLTARDVRETLEVLQSNAARRGIMVTDATVTMFARTAILDLAPMYVLQAFHESELLVDITEHFMVPEHQVLSLEEKAELLKKTGAKDMQLPRMMLDDPIAKYYGLIKGQVVKIIRKSENSGRYVHFRIVL